MKRTMRWMIVIVIAFGAYVVSVKPPTSSSGLRFEDIKTDKVSVFSVKHPEQAHGNWFEEQVEVVR